MAITRRRIVATSVGGIALLSGCLTGSDQSHIIIDNNTNDTISGSVELMDPSGSSTVLSESFNIPSEDRAKYDISVSESSLQTTVQSDGRTESWEWEIAPERPITLSIDINGGSIEYGASID
ncbi:hypothetical protein [Halorubellus sp. PRR65]|uniref:hypothetical protein n=1 Tax=Halorubellus sp. PRR65 TaxID=3098148 RepID=UPI002B25E3A6|nr:hypothetical protein [Halorubellus sp. PRR65]